MTKIITFLSEGCIRVVSFARFFQFYSFVYYMHSTQFSGNLCEYQRRRPSRVNLGLWSSCSSKNMCVCVNTRGPEFHFLFGSCSQYLVSVCEFFSVVNIYFLINYFPVFFFWSVYVWFRFFRMTKNCITSGKIRAGKLFEIKQASDYLISWFLENDMNEFGWSQLQKQLWWLLRN